jgi:hypothetical protein
VYLAGIELRVFGDSATPSGMQRHRAEH